MELKFICNICGKECKNNIALSSHIQYNHKEYNSKKYYDTFIKKDINEGKCEVCGKETPFYSILRGYSKYCCKSCSHKTEQFRQRFKQAIRNKTKEENKEWRSKIQKAVKDKSTTGKCITDEELKNRENKCLLKYQKEYPYLKEYHNKIASGVCPECGKSFEIDRWTLHNRNKLHLPICMNCYPINYTRQSGQSCFEKEVYDFIVSNYDKSISRNNRTILESMELDIWLPDVRVGIECDGTYWHADSRFFKPDDIIKQTGHKAIEIWKKDEEKNDLAKSKDVILYRIKEHDWKINKEQEKKKLLDLLKNL